MRGLKAAAFVALSFGVLSTAGCGEKDLSTPPKIVYGRDACAECRMILQDDRFACAAVSPEGRYLKFDDIGCLAEHEKKQGALDRRAWAHDLDGAGWIAKDTAYFVHCRDMVTPMGYGFAAFGSLDSAKKFTEEKGGRVVSWEELTGSNHKTNDLKMEEGK